MVTVVAGFMGDVLFNGVVSNDRVSRWADDWVKEGAFDVLVVVFGKQLIIEFDLDGFFLLGDFDAAGGSGSFGGLASGDHAVKDAALFDEGDDAVGGFGAGFEEDPPLVIHRDEKVHKLLVGVRADVELSDVNGIAETVFDEVEVVFETFAGEVLGVGVPADGDVGMVGDVHDLFDDGQR